MNVEQLLRAGQRALVLPVVGTAVRGLARRVPLRALMQRHAAPRTGMGLGAPLVGAFLLGAVAGAGLLLFFAPGSEELRRTIARRLSGLTPQTASERARAAAFASATRADHDHDHDHDHEHEHEHEHDEHGRPRRRNHPRA